MYSDLPAPFCVKTPTNYYLGILSCSEDLILENACLVSNLEEDGYSNYWISTLISTPDFVDAELHYMGYVDLEQELCTVYRCHPRWLSVLRREGEDNSEPTKASVIPITLNKTT